MQVTYRYIWALVVNRPPAIALLRDAHHNPRHRISTARSTSIIVRRSTYRCTSTWCMLLRIADCICADASLQYSIGIASRCASMAPCVAQRLFAERSCTTCTFPPSTTHFSLEISATNASFSDTVVTAPLKFFSACVSAATESLSR